MRKLSALFLCLALLFCFLPGANATEETFVKVTSADELTPGDRIIIAAAWYDKAMGSQTASARSHVSVTKEGDAIPYTDGIQVITLEAGSLAGTWAFRVEDGYLCASSSSSNHLKTSPTLDANGSWSITIENGEASIAAQGSSSRNVMQYHANSGIFSCYAAATQTALVIYKSTSAPGKCGHPETELIPVSGSTHSIVCTNENCSDPVLDTVSCAFSIADRGDGYHMGICPCGNESQPFPHDFDADHLSCFCGAVGYPGDTVTVSQAVAMMRLLGNDTTHEKYRITGIITGSSAVCDTDGNTLAVSGTEDLSAYNPGDTVTLLGNLSAGGMVNAQVTAHSPYVCTHSGYGEDYLCDGCGLLIPPTADTALTIPEALRLGAAFPESASPSNYTEGKYLVTGVVAKVTETAYGVIEIKDEHGNILTVYGLYDENGHRYDDMNSPPKLGNTVTVCGVIGKYQTTVQMKNAVVTVHDTHTCDFSPATCLTPQTCNICGKTQGTSLGHDLREVPAAAPTQEAEGCLAHWSCIRCARLFSDAQGLDETTREAVTLEKLPSVETEPPSEPTESQPAYTAPETTAPSAHAEPSTQPSTGVQDPSSNTDRTMILVCAVFLAVLTAALLFVISRKE